jgi:hypothetical protein
MFRCFHSLIIFLFPLILVASTVLPGNQAKVNNNPGYSALRLFLEDEQHLTTVRRIKSLISFRTIDDSVANLVDDIADISEAALDELDTLSTLRPEINFESLAETSIARATFDSLRYTTAEKFLRDGDDFEKNLLLSQIQILPVIVHLSQQLEENENRIKRKHWLYKLGLKYNVLYQRANAQLKLSDAG